MSKKTPSHPPSIEEMKEALQAAGYEVTRRASYVKHTFVVEESVYSAFRECVAAKSYLVRDAVTEALMLWLERHRS